MDNARAARGDAFLDSYCSTVMLLIGPEAHVVCSTTQLYSTVTAGTQNGSRFTTYCKAWL